MALLLAIVLYSRRFEFYKRLGVQFWNAEQPGPHVREVQVLQKKKKTYGGFGGVIMGLSGGLNKGQDQTFIFQNGAVLEAMSQGASYEGGIEKDFTIRRNSLCSERKPKRFYFLISWLFWGGFCFKHYFH